jgi:ketosteroid isomerase-like protein
MSTNAEIARRAYEAFQAGDMAAMGELMSGDIVWHAPGENPLSGTYRGKEEVFGLFAKIGELADGPMKMGIHDILASDDHVVALLEVTASRGDKRLDGRAVHIMHVADGKLTEFWNFPEDPAAGDEFWS